MSEPRADRTGYLASRRDVALLCGAAFALNFGAGHWWVALPFIVKRLGGSDTMVGTCLAVHMGAYALTILAAGPLLYRFNAKRVVQAGVGCTVAFTGAMCGLVGASWAGWRVPHAIGMLTGLTAVLGMSLAAFWPPLLGWLSAGSEGGVLSRRLGLFSLWVSIGTLLSPYPGGVLVEAATVLPVAAAVVIQVGCLALASLAANPGGAGAAEGAARPWSAGPGARGSSVPDRFRWLARVALYAVFVSVGLSRTQAPLLLKLELGYSESTYGVFLTATFLASTLVYWLAGRTQYWHHRLWLFLAAQGLVLAFGVVMLAARELPLLLTGSVALGLGGAFTYNSHLYYGVSGGGRRSAGMAIHEFTLAAGYCTGGVAGGWLSDAFGRRAPYWLGAGVLIGALIVEAVLWRRSRGALPPGAPAPGGR